jgi:catechol 2,3-dioxygenase-like lactoylglutathione lyase family enzyme
MTRSLSQSPALRFHISLNVANLERSVAFYRTLFNMEPAKLRGDYAKFEPDDPPLVVSLEPSGRPGAGTLNHLGFRMPDARSLVAMQERLERAGIHSQREEGVECCYAKQTKFWVTDPDATLWEIYTLEGDLEHRGVGQQIDAMLPSKPAAAISWEHRLGQPIPERIDHADNSVDEVLLRGTLNVQLPAATQQRLVAEAKRVLRPGGRLFVHVLTAEKPFVGKPDLPGPAAYVQHTPVEDEPVRLVESAGFTNVRMVKFDSKPCFVRQGIGMRELQLEGFKPAQLAANGSLEVLYTGPFDQIEIGGVALPRGRRTRVPGTLAEQVRAANGAVVVFDSPAGEAKHGTDCGA